MKNQVRHRTKKRSRKPTRNLGHKKMIVKIGQVGKMARTKGIDLIPTRNQEELYILETGLSYSRIEMPVTKMTMAMKFMTKIREYLQLTRIQMRKNTIECKLMVLKMTRKQHPRQQRAIQWIL